jgi:ABC-type uncharacterized transport system permease subunit
MRLLDLMAQGIVPASILALAAYGELLVERAGMINLGLEGVIYLSAATSAYAAATTSSLLLGVLTGVTTGILLLLLYYLMAVVARVNQIVVGLAIVFLGIGLGDVVGYHIAGVPLPNFAPYRNIVGALAIITGALGLYLLLYKSWYGYVIRSLGEDEKAAISLGVNSKLVRLIIAIIAGSLAGIAGAILFLSRPGTWSANVALGWGWLALGTVILGYWHPIGVAIASYLVGFIDTLTLVFEAHGIPPAIAENTPYILVMIALIIVSWIYERIGVRPPAAIWAR